MNEELLNSFVVPAEPPTDADPAQVSNIQIRGPNGERLLRRVWKQSTTINDLVNFYKKEIKSNVNIQMVVPFPKKDLTELSLTLEQYAFGKSETVMAKHV